MSLLKVPRMWEGEDVWILGGGPSLPVEFGVPKHVIQGVIEGALPPSSYSEYLKPIHDKHVIGINAAFLIGNWIDIVFFGDNSFFLRYRELLMKFPGLKVTCASNIGSDKVWVKCLGRDARKPRGISNDPHLVSWNSNSGAAAISLAVHTGAKRIILLGFDMKLNEDRRQHWHDLYKKGVYDRPDKLRKLPFERHLRGFEQIAKDAKDFGVEIINASPDSAITQFPKVSVKELLSNNG